MPEREEIFKARIDIEALDPKEIEGSLDRMRTFARETVDFVENAFASMELDFSGIENAAAGLKQSLSGLRVFDSFVDEAKEMSMRLVGGSIIPEMTNAILDYMGRIEGGVIPSMQTIRAAMMTTFQDARDSGKKNLTGLNQDWNTTLRSMQASGQLTAEQVSVLSIAMTQMQNQFKLTAKTIKDTAGAFEKQAAAAENFERLMEGASKQTRGFRDGLALARGGEGLLGLRVALYGSSDATETFARNIDRARNVMKLFQRDTTGQERALIKSVSAFQENAIQVRNAANELKEWGVAEGIAKGELDQLTESVRRQMNAAQRQAQAAQNNKEINQAGIAELQNGNEIIRTQIRILEDHVRTTGKSSDQLDEYIATLRKQIDVSDREIEIIEKKNKASKISRQEKEKDEKATKGQTSALKRLIPQLNLSLSVTRKTGDAVKIFSATTHAAVAPVRQLGNVVQVAHRSMWQMAAVFTMVNSGFELMQNLAMKATESFRKFKDEMLGFGVINDFISQLTTGVVEFAAETRLGLVAIDFMGAQVAESVGRDAALAVDALRAKLVTLQAQGIGVAESIELVKKSLAVGFPIGPIGEMTGEILSQETTLAELIKLYERGEIGLETIGRAAQNWASVMGGSSSELATKFVDATIRMRTEILETNQLSKNASQLQQEYADAVGEALSELTDQEKQVAVLLGILNQTLPAAGAYEEAMGGVEDTIKATTQAYKDGNLTLKEYLAAMSETNVEIDNTGKLMGSMQRYVDDTRAAIGDLFLPVLSKLLLQLKGFLVAIQEIAQSEAAKRFADAIGSLVSQFTFISPIIAFAIDNFAALANMISGLLEAIAALKGGRVQDALEGFKKFVIDAITTVALFINNTIGGAINWGWNLIANLANGIIEAAQTILVRAAEFVGSILALFFESGSPPAKGPLSKIDKWGSGLMRTLGDSMSAAAEGAMTGVAGSMGAGLLGGLSLTFRNLELTSLQAVKALTSTVRGLFQSMVSMGQMRDVDMAPALIDVRDLLVDLSNQFEETGEISEEILSNITSKLGDAGADFEKYIRLQFELRQARDDLKQIDAEIAAAEAAGFATAGLIKRKEEAEKRISELDEQYELQKELLSWQQESNSLVAEQVKLLKRIADQNERAAQAQLKQREQGWEGFLETYEAELAALETKKALGIITEEEYQRGRLALEKRYIDTAIKMGVPLSDSRIDAFKRLQDIVAGLTKKGGGGLGDMATATERSAFMLDSLLDSFKKTETIGKTSIGGVTKEFEEMRQRVVGIFDGVKAFLRTPIATHLKRIAKQLGEWFDVPLFEWFGELAETAENVINRIWGFFQWLYDVLVGHSLIPDMVRIIKGLFTGLIDFIRGLFSGIFSGGGIGAAGRAFVNIIRSIIERLVQAVNRISHGFQDIFGGNAVKNVKSFGTTMETVGRQIGTAISPLKIVWRDFSNVVEWTLDHIFPPLTEFILALANGFFILITRLAEMDSLRRLIDRVWGLFKLIGGVVVGIIAGGLILFDTFMPILSDVMEPLAKAIANVIDLVSKGLVNAINGVLGPFEFLFNLATRGPEAVVDSTDRVIDDFKRGLIPTLALTTIAWKTGLLGAMKTFVTYAAGAVKGTLIALVGKLKLVAGAIRTLSISGFIASIKVLATSIGTTLVTAAGALLTPLGLLVIAIGAVVGGFVAWFYWQGQINKQVNRGKKEINEWSEEVREMAAEGKTAGEIVDVMAGAVNEARRKFDKAGPLADVFGKGKDVELFKEASEEALRVIIEQAGTYEEYLELIDRWNTTVSDDTIRITEDLTESQWELQHSTVAVVDEGEQQRITLEKIAEKGGIAGEAAQKLLDKMDESAAAVKRSTQAGITYTEELNRRRMAEVDYRAAVEDRRKKQEDADRQLLNSLISLDPKIASMYEDRIDSEKIFGDERVALVYAYEEELKTLQATGTAEEVAALKQKHVDELAEIDDRYAQEDLKRKQAIGLALLDLHNEITAKKALNIQAAGGSLEELAALEEFQGKRAEAIARVYPIDLNAEQAKASADALTTVILTSDDIEKDLSTTTDAMLVTIAKLGSEGYDALSAEQQALVTGIAVQNILWKKDSEDTADDIVASLAAIPPEYHKMILAMAQADLPFQAILDAVAGIKDAKIQVEIEAKYDALAKGSLQPQSPKTQLQIALENLVAYTEGHPVEISIGTDEGAVPFIDSLTAALSKMMDVAQPALDKASRLSSNLQRTFWGMHKGIVGPGGSVTNLSRGVIESIRTLWPKIEPLIANFRSKLVFEFTRAASEAVMGFATQFLKLYDLLEDIFTPGSVKWAGRASIIDKIYDWGVDTMKALSYGIRDGFLDWVYPMLRFIMDHFPHSPAELGPFSDPISWSGLSAGLPSELDRIRNQMKTLDGIQIGDARMQSGIGLAGAVGPVTTYYIDSLVFPGVTDADEASLIFNDLDDRIRSANALKSFVGAF